MPFSAEGVASVTEGTTTKKFCKQHLCGMGEGLGWEVGGGCAVLPRGLGLEGMEFLQGMHQGVRVALAHAIWSNEICCSKTYGHASCKCKGYLAGVQLYATVTWHVL